VPSWVSALADEPRRPSPLPRWASWGVGALAALLALVLWVPRGPEETRSPLSGIRAKGGPAMALYVKHGDSVRLWDGMSPVASGDLLRLKVMPEGFTWLTVAAAEGTSWQVLHEGPLSAQGETLLPTSWRVEPGEQPERLLVVLAHEPLPSDSLSRLDAEAPRTDDVWVFPLTLPHSSVP
jgi:hypothetical protein